MGGAVHGWPGPETGKTITKTSWPGPRRSARKSYRRPSRDAGLDLTKGWPVHRGPVVRCMV